MNRWSDEVFQAIVAKFISYDIDWAVIDFEALRVALLGLSIPTVTH